MEDLIHASVCGATRWPWGDSYLCCGNPKATAQIMSASRSCQGRGLPSQQVVWRTPHCWLWCGPSWLLFSSSWDPAPCALTPTPSLQTVTRMMVLLPPLRQPTNTCAHLAPDSPSTLSDLRSTYVSHTLQIHRHLTITRIPHIFVTSNLLLSPPRFTKYMEHKMNKKKTSCKAGVPLPVSCGSGSTVAVALPNTGKVVILQVLSSTCVQC